MVDAFHTKITGTDSTEIEFKMIENGAFQQKFINNKLSKTFNTLRPL